MSASAAPTSSRNRAARRLSELSSRLRPWSLPITIGSLSLPILVLALVWYPELAHDGSPQVRIPASSVVSARAEPSDAVLLEVRDLDVLPIEGLGPARDIALAEGILAGELSIPGFGNAPIHVPFSPDDLDGIPEALQLRYAGFAVPELLLSGFVASGREEFFRAARDFIAAWDRYERQSPLQRGLLWNDHAITARVRVLAEFWRIYRTRSDYDPERGRAVLEQAARYGHLLSDPGHFTFSSNHGVMQNLGLLQLSLAFPALPDSATYHAAALERLDGQLAFFIDRAGVIRENSAGYQAFGLDILAKIFRSMTLLGDPIPRSWSDRYSAGLAFLSTLLRPDRTLPTTGDTDGGTIGAGPLETEIDPVGRATELRSFRARSPALGETLDADAGYWIDWSPASDGSGAATSQTVVTWTSPPGPAHKHADEMGVLLWSHGTSWLTATGYWPYSMAGRSEAESWDGSNAPHRADESATSTRSTHLRVHGSRPDLAAVDIERSGPGDQVVRRQVIRVGEDTWLILDFVNGGGSGTWRTTWTFSPDLGSSASADDGSFSLSDAAGTAVGRFEVIGSPGAELTAYRGSLAPFAGWQVVGGEPHEAPAVVVEQHGSSAWLGVVLSATSGSSAGPFVTGQPTETEVDSPDRWSLTLPTTQGPVEVRRSGEEIRLTSGTGDPTRVSLELTAGPDTAAESAEIRAAFAAMASEYPAFRSLVPRRTTVSFAILALFAVQELVLWGVRRRLPDWYLLLRLIGIACWIGVGISLPATILDPWEVLALVVIGP